MADSAAAPSCAAAGTAAGEPRATRTTAHRYRAAPLHCSGDGVDEEGSARAAATGAGGEIRAQHAADAAFEKHLAADVDRRRSVPAEIERRRSTAAARAAGATERGGCGVAAAAAISPEGAVELAGAAACGREPPARSAAAAAFSAVPAAARAVVRSQQERARRSRSTRQCIGAVSAGADPKRAEAAAEPGLGCRTAAVRAAAQVAAVV